MPGLPAADFQQVFIIPLSSVHLKCPDGDFLLM